MLRAGEAALPEGSRSRREKGRPYDAGRNERMGAVLLVQQDLGLEVEYECLAKYEV